MTMAQVTGLKVSLQLLVVDGTSSQEISLPLSVASQIKSLAEVPDAIAAAARKAIALLDAGLAKQQLDEAQAKIKALEKQVASIPAPVVRVQEPAAQPTANPFAPLTEGPFAATFGKSEEKPVEHTSKKHRR